MRQNVIRTARPGSEFSTDESDDKGNHEEGYECRNIFLYASALQFDAKSEENTESDESHEEFPPESKGGQLLPQWNYLCCCSLGQVFTKCPGCEFDSREIKCFGKHSKAGNDDDYCTDPDCLPVFFCPEVRDCLFIFHIDKLV